MTKFLGGGVLILLAELLVAVTNPRTDEYQISQAVKRVFNNVIEGDYSIAAEHVYFFDQYTDLEPTITQEHGKELWVNRMKALDNKTDSFVRYENLLINEDDGVLKGRVDLLFEKTGKQIVIEDVLLMSQRKTVSGNCNMLRMETLDRLNGGNKR